MLCSFTDQVLGQLDLLRNTKENGGYKDGIYLLLKALDGKVANLHLPALGAELTKLSKAEPALNDRIEIDKAGPMIIHQSDFINKKFQ